MNALSANQVIPHLLSPIYPSHFCSSLVLLSSVVVAFLRSSEFVNLRSSSIYISFNIAGATMYTHIGESEFEVRKKKDQNEIGYQS